MTRFATTLAILLFSAYAIQAQQLDKKQLAWYTSYTWLNGLSLRPHPSVNKAEFIRQYQAHTRLWNLAFDYLKTHDLASLVPGKYPIAGDSVFVSVTEIVDKDLDQTQWESHRKYVDLQYVASGKEKMGIAPVTSATVTDPYNESKDAAHYQSEGTYYVAEPGTFFLFFPTDAHRPNIKVNEEKVKKVVIKIKAA
jgi:biofilm protein TabA